ncbi:MAG TPA: hypothetical protein VF719_12765 [Abditibacteriaceae bacterium]|jgi:hypothetical protein
MINNKLHLLFVLPALVTSSLCAVAQEATNQAPATVPAMPANPTGWDLLMRAHDMLKQMPQGRIGGGQMAEDSPEDIAAMRAYTDANAESLRLVSEALELPLVLTSAITKDDGLFPAINRNALLRQLGRMMMQRARVLAADGDLRGAVQTNLDIVTLGAKTQHGGALIESLSGGAIESMGRSNLRRILPRLDAVLAREAATRLLAVDALHPSYEAVIRAEKVTGILALEEMFKDDNWKKFRAGNNKAVEKSGWEMSKDEVKTLQTTTDATIVNDYMAVLDAAIERATRPYDNSVAPIKPPRDALSRQMAQLFLRRVQPAGRTNFERNHNLNRMLAVAFTLQAYKAENFEYPVAIDALIPKYLDLIPPDSFNKNQRLRYRRTFADYRLYSVGPDGVDNDGEPTFEMRELREATQPNAKPLRNYNSIRDESKGDIVFGINN